MSGRLPYHVNSENHPPNLAGGGVPLGMTTLADQLRTHGNYSTHQVCVVRVCCACVLCVCVVRACVCVCVCEYVYDLNDSNL
jgi:hypothetical protein